MQRLEVPGLREAEREREKLYTVEVMLESLNFILRFKKKKERG